jgi:hypothetical protein
VVRSILDRGERKVDQGNGKVKRVKGEDGGVNWRGAFDVGVQWYARLKMPVSLIRVALPPCTSHVKASLASILDSSATSPITFRGAYSIMAE